MSKPLAIALDYAFNALVSAGLGALVAVGIVLARGESSVGLGLAAGCSLIGAACGTASKLTIEGAFALFGKRLALGYLLNAAIVALLVWAGASLVFGGFRGLGLPELLLCFLLPELASVLIVRFGIYEAKSLERSFEAKREELGDCDRD